MLHLLENELFNLAHVLEDLLSLARSAPTLLVPVGVSTPLGDIAALSLPTNASASSGLRKHKWALFLMYARIPTPLKVMPVMLSLSGIPTKLGIGKSRNTSAVIDSRTSPE